ncbi:MAG: toprim domain-containing protein [Burkholderiales bacterium]
MDNYAAVLHQMQAFGVDFKAADLPLTIPTPKRKTCGAKGKYWYWLQLFRPRNGGCFVVGKFGTYRHGGSECKVDVDWRELADADKERLAAERLAAAERARLAKAEGAALAALGAAELWRRASPQGRSPYLARKGVQAEACRYLPDGTLVVPLLRYDWPRGQALCGVQRVLPDGTKLFTKGFAKPGCAVRLGVVQATDAVVLVCEGYATGLTLRMATAQAVAVYVALDAGNLAHVLPLLRELHPACHLLVCADDDWRTVDPHNGELTNPGRTAARAVCKQVSRADFVWPVFDAATRQAKDTDYNDLHQRGGLPAVQRQLAGVLAAMGVAIVG